jgi:serine O-acetyltransferase
LLGAACRMSLLNSKGRMGLLAQVVEDWKTNGRDWTRPGFQALAVHRFGNWRMRVKPKLMRAPLSVAYRALFRGVRNVYGIELPYSAHIGRRVVIEHQGSIVVHGNAVVGDECILRQNVTLGNRTMDQPWDAPILGARVNVGAGAKILGAVTIGEGAQVGANAVVHVDVPSGAVAVGVPARLITNANGISAGAPMQPEDRSPSDLADSRSGELDSVTSLRSSQSEHQTRGS